MAAISDFASLSSRKSDSLILLTFEMTSELGVEDEIAERPPDEFGQIPLRQTVPFSNPPPDRTLVSHMLRKLQWDRRCHVKTEMLGDILPHPFPTKTSPLVILKVSPVAFLSVAAHALALASRPASVN